MKIEKRDKDRLLIIDDNPNCYLNYEDHIIQISYWEGDSSNDSLYKIQNILFSFIEKYSSLSSDNLSEKEKDLKFNVKISKVLKEYIDLKDKIDLLKKKIIFRNK